MYKRLLRAPVESKNSFFLFGPRGTGKTTWGKKTLPSNHVYINLLEGKTFRFLSSNPSGIIDVLPKEKNTWIFIDEVQRIPELLNEIHFLIEEGYRFALTGSSARKLRRGGVNLLGGRARVYYFFPLTLQEIGEKFKLIDALSYGLLPTAYKESQSREHAERYLDSYISSYLAEEVKEERLTLKLDYFNKFLEVASFSQGSPINMTNIARECYINRLTVANYFSILEDLLLGTFIYPFTSRAKREIVKQPKFYFFDTGVYRMLRNLGPLDRTTQVEGPALETLIFHHLRALNEYLYRRYKIYFWRTKQGEEVDFILHKRGYPTIAIEVKSSTHVHKKDLKGLLSFRQSYPDSQAFLVYNGVQRQEQGIALMSIESFLKKIHTLLEE